MLNAEFWSRLLGTPIIDAAPNRPSWLRLQPLAPRGPIINFQPVPEQDVGKAQLHVDVLVSDLESGVSHVLSLGGTDTGAREDLSRGRIAIMRDPGGNIFCLLAPSPS